MQVNPLLFINNWTVCARLFIDCIAVLPANCESFVTPPLPLPGNQTSHKFFLTGAAFPGLNLLAERYGTELLTETVRLLGSLVEHLHLRKKNLKILQPFMVNKVR